MSNLLTQKAPSLFSSFLASFIAISFIHPAKASAPLWSAGGRENIETNFRSLQGFLKSPIGLNRSVDLARQSWIKSFLNNSTASLIPTRRTASSKIGLETLFVQARHQGIEVVGSGVLQHINSAGRITYTNRLAAFDLNAAPTLNASDARALVRSMHEGYDTAGATRLRVLPNEDEVSARLTWWIRAKDINGTREPRQLILDAHSGEVIADYSLHYSIAPIHVFEANSNCQEVDESGEPVSLKLGDCVNSVFKGQVLRIADDSARRAFENSRKALEFYDTQFDRDGIDGKGSDVVSVVHAGVNFDNAFWSDEGQMMAYGDGDGVTTGDFTLGLDVAGHEMTHGVISSTANLAYFGESGALNEAYADIFGKLIEGSNNWRLGTALFLNPDENSAIRDLKTPGSLTANYFDEKGQIVTKPYPRTLAERFRTTAKCDGKNDNCFVHINSTIQGHTGYQVIKALGRSNAAQLFYATLTQYLTERTNFVQNKSATLKACNEIGLLPSECAKVEAIFVAQGY